MLRIDPLTESKAFDVDFFGDEEYKKHREVVEKYLKNEGFETLEPGKEFIIQIIDRWWSIKNINT